MKTSDYYNHVNQLVSHYTNFSGCKNLLAAFEEKIKKPDWSYPSNLVLPLSVYQEILTEGIPDGELKFKVLVASHSLIYAHQWSKFKQILLFDNDLSLQLIDSDFSENIPSDLIVERLPYPCFYVGTPGLETFAVNGFFVHLTKERNDSYYSLRLGFDFADYPVASIPVPLLNTISSSLDEVEKTYNKPFTPQHLVKLREGKLRDAIRELAEIALKHLYYLLSDNCDREIPVTRKNAGKVKYPTVQKVGYNLGLYFNRDGSHKESTGTGVSKASHIRRGHFHSYRVGKGREKIKVKWLAPILVNRASGEIEGSVKKVD